MVDQKGENGAKQSRFSVHSRGLRLGNGGRMGPSVALVRNGRCEEAVLKLALRITS